MFYETAKNNHGLPFNPFKSCVVPRPIGWISTVSHDGIINLAPFSMFNQLNYDPPFVCFSGSNRTGSGRRKDSVTNAEETGEFVVNMATYELREQINMTSRHVDPEVDEFDLAGLQKLPSKLVRPPRVAESPIHLECRYHGTWTLPANQRHSTHHVVVGEVIGIHIRDDVIGADGKIDIKKIRPLARLGYMDYTSVTDVLTMQTQANAASQVGEAVAKLKVAV